MMKIKYSELMTMKKKMMIMQISTPFKAKSKTKLMKMTMNKKKKLKMKIKHSALKQREYDIFFIASKKQVAMLHSFFLFKTRIWILRIKMRAMTLF
jgi:helix-turn-helix protein